MKGKGTEIEDLEFLIKDPFLRESLAKVADLYLKADRKRKFGRKGKAVKIVDEINALIWEK